MSFLKKKKPSKAPAKKTTRTTVPDSNSPKRRKQTNITDTYESHGLELEITILQIDNSIETVGSRIRPAAGAEWIYFDPGKLNDLALVLREAGHPKP